MTNNMKTHYPQLPVHSMAGNLKKTITLLCMVIFTALMPVKLFAQAPAISSFTPITGPVGTLVTLSGSNLSSPTAFTIGGATAIVVSNDGSTLVGMVMPGAVTGAVSLTAAGGTATGSGNFTVTKTPFPTTQQGAKLVGTGNTGAAQQGSAVAVSADGNTAIVGGYADNNNEGAAWIYTRSGGTWTQQGPKLVGTDDIGAAWQGYSVSLSADGNTAIVGGQNDNSSQGAAWVYTRSGGSWTQQGAKLVATDNTGVAGQGESVFLSADGNTAILGGPGDNSGVGAAWVYTRSGGTWTQQGAKLVGTGNAGGAGQGFSASLSADGNTAIVGGFADNSQQGAAWVYTRSGGTWTQQGAKLVGTGNTGPAFQGVSVSISADGNTAIVGGNDDNSSVGAAWVYTRSGGTWTQQGAKLVGTGNVGASQQGGSVSISADGNTAFVGGLGDNSALGAAWVYTRSGGTWTQQGPKLVGTGNIGRTGLGYFVSLSADGNTAIAGANVDNSLQGAAWVFVALTPPTTQASNVTFSGTTKTTTTASWTKGNGAARAVFVAAASSGSPSPVDQTSYNANAVFGSGDQVGSSGWYCVYNGTGSTVNITGLTPGTTYQVMAVEYNSIGADVAYLTTAGTGNPAGVTTLPSPVISSFSPATGPVGTLVTITGADLSSPTAFTIGGATAIVVSNNGSTLVGMVMPGAVTGAVSLTNADGTSTGIGNFTVTATPFPLAQQGAKLVGTGAIGGAGQGNAVAVSADGNTAIVGGYLDNSQQGAAWVYTRSGGTWTQQGAKLVGTGNIGAAAQGWSVSLSADGNTAIVGGFQDNSNQGAAWVYTRSGGAWAQQGAKLVGTGNIGAAWQGYSVSLSADGNTAIVGGYNDHSENGAAWVYTRSGSTWTQQGAKLVGTHNLHAEQGWSVSLSADGNTAIIGGWLDNSANGAAWVYTRSGSTWTQQGEKLVGTGNTGAAEQGWSVSLSADGNTAIVGGVNDNTGQGAAWVYTRSGGAWTQQGAKLVGTGNAGAAQQGYSVSLSADGNTAIAGGWGDNSNQGAAWVYTRSSGAWTQQGAKLVGTGNTGTAEQGWSVSLSADGSTAMAGGPGDSSPGAVWAFIPLAAPATQATNVTFTTTTTTTTTANWTNGGGTARAVFMLAGSSGSPAPVDLTGYNANAAFGSGDQVGSSGWYCVYNGTGSTVNITGLTAGTTYQVMTVEYNGTGSNVAYLTTAGTGNPAGFTTISTDATLSALGVSNNSITPVFAPSTTTYTLTVSAFRPFITVTPITNNPNATVTVNGQTVVSGSPSQNLPMSIGNNPVTIVVTAQDNSTTKTYNLTVTKTPSNNAKISNLQLSNGSLSPLFVPTTNSYTATVGNTISSITVTPRTADTGARIKVNGAAVVTNTASLPISLNIGQNTITVTGTAQDGTTTDTYTIVVTRAGSNNANLSSLRFTNPNVAKTAVAGPDYADYTASVSNATTSIEVIPTTAVSTSSVTVNNATVISGSASSAIPLSVGANTITTVVTAQDGVTTHAYVITVTRATGVLLNTAYQQVSVSNPTDHPQMIGEEINVHQGLSPNGDGINDFLMIDGIGNYPDNKLQIMNRSGILVFEAKGYDNSTKVFDGHSNKNGAMQLPGTYFYSLEYAINGITKHKTGFIVLKY
jgi:gliding motility-associated-like protein